MINSLLLNIKNNLIIFHQYTTPIHVHYDYSNGLKYSNQQIYRSINKSIISSLTCPQSSFLIAFLKLFKVDSS